MALNPYEETKRQFYGTGYQLRDMMARVISGKNPDGSPFEFPALEDYTVVAGGGKASFEHDQLTPSAAWHIVHNLNTFPSVVVVDTSGTTFIPDVEYIDEDELVVKFAGATAGHASLHS